METDQKPPVGIQIISFLWMISAVLGILMLINQYRKSGTTLFHYSFSPFEILFKIFGYGLILLVLVPGGIFVGYMLLKLNYYAWVTLVFELVIIEFFLLFFIYTGLGWYSDLEVGIWIIIWLLLASFLVYAFRVQDKFRLKSYSKEKIPND